MMRPLLLQFLTAAGLYAAFLSDVTVRAATTTWVPNFALLAAFAVMRRPGGVFWATMAGMLCDGITGRPLGVTMIVAALVATIMRVLHAGRPKNFAAGLMHAFLFVSLVELCSRLLANTVAPSSDVTESLLDALWIALTTIVLIAPAYLFRRSDRRSGFGAETQRDSTTLAIPRLR